MRRFERPFWILACLALIAGLAWSQWTVSEFKQRAAAATRLAAGVLVEMGFEAAVPASARELAKAFGSGIEQIEGSGLQLVAVEKTSLRVRSSRRAVRRSRPRAGAAAPKTTPAAQAVPLPWTDGRLTLERYHDQALDYSLDQRFRAQGSYIADMTGEIRFGAFELVELGDNGEPLEGSQSEVTEYELLALREPARSEERPLKWGVFGGVTAGGEGRLKGLFAGPRLRWKGFGIGLAGQVDDTLAPGISIEVEYFP
ncbi:MAG: hypothetical protein P9M14_04985 [Candidatus Alcyoniella australis]|nr:hypothetical protein [Candidatus Alcyoniella australis]